MYSLEEINNMSEPYELFDGDLNNVEFQYVELMKHYHPHLNKQQQQYIEVANKINSLFKSVEEKMKSGKWTTAELLKIPLDNGKTYTMKYSYSSRFDLGTMYVSDTKVLYLFNRENKYLADNAIKKIEGISYKSDDVKQEFYKYIPKIIDKFKTANKKSGIVIEKKEELVMLKEFIRSNSGRISINTLGWVLKNIYNLYCFINFNKLNHNAITMENYFISPDNHWGALLGGWWYAVNDQDQLLGVDSKVEMIIPEGMKSNNKANIILDLESIKLIGRIILGDGKYERLLINREVSKELKIWLKTDVSNNPFLEYINWSKLVMNIK